MTYALNSLKIKNPPFPISYISSLSEDSPINKKKHKSFYNFFSHINVEYLSCDSYLIYGSYHKTSQRHTLRIKQEILKLY